MEQFFNILKEYWFLILFVCGGIGGAVMYLINLIKMKIPSLDRRIKKIEKNVFDDKGNEMIVTNINCGRFRLNCSSSICKKIDKVEEVIIRTSKETTESLKINSEMVSASAKDLHEKREAATMYTNEQINKLTLALGGVQGELKRIVNGGSPNGTFTNNQTG